MTRSKSESPRCATRELAYYVADETGYGVEESREMISCVRRGIIAALRDGRRVWLQGIGELSVRFVPSRKLQSNLDGRIYHSGSKNVITFRGFKL